jgi:hypothetical protein
MHHACCKLGIPSVHWNKYCPPSSSSNSSSNSSYSNINDIEKGIHLQQDVIKTAAALWKQYPRKKTKEENLALYRRLQEHVASIVKSSSIAAIHDVPYIQMLPFILQVAKEANRPVILLLSTRDANEWVKSRSQNHPSVVDVICTKHADYAFDLQECMKDYEQEQENDSSNLMNRYFIPYGKFQQEKQTRQQQLAAAEFLNFTAHAMARHQERVIRTMSPALVINFWEQQTNSSSMDNDKTDNSWEKSMDMLANKIWNAATKELLVVSNHHHHHHDAMQTFQRQSYRHEIGGNGLKNIQVRGHNCSRNMKRRDDEGTISTL